MFSQVGRFQYDLVEFFFVFGIDVRGDQINQVALRFECFKQFGCIVPDLFKQVFGCVGIGVSRKRGGNRCVFDVGVGRSDIGGQTFEETVEGVECVAAGRVAEPHRCADAFGDSFFEQCGFGRFEFGA